MADDHTVVRAGICQFLEQVKDIEVVAEAEDGQMAGDLIQEYKPVVAVLDVQMPKSTGIGATRWVQANCRDIGVLVLTAYDDEPYVMAVQQARANGFVLKTAAPAEIVQAVRDVNEGKSALDPMIDQMLRVHFAGFGGPPPAYESLTDRELDCYL